MCLREIIVNVERRFVVLSGFLKIVCIRQQFCFMEVCGGIVLIDFGYLVEIVLGFLGII